DLSQPTETGNELLTQDTSSLGLSATSLLRLGVGWSAPYRAWAFPMRDAGGAIRGIRLRTVAGKKFCVRGSKDGLFIPEESAAVGPLLVCEGPTDTAALLDMGFA